MAVLLRLFFDLPEAQVLEIRNTAIALIAEGKTLMEVSSGGKTGQKQFPMPPKDVVFEANAALRKIDPDTYGRRRRFTVSRVRQSNPYGYL